MNKDPALPDPVAGYACLYGGNGDQDRAASGQEPWSRLQGFGPAFFTKFLYFSTPGALVLDNRLANAVHKLSQLPNLVNANRQSRTVMNDLSETSRRIVAATSRS